LTNRKPPEDLTPSICEAALGRFSQSDDSLAGVIEQHHIEVREFMVLSLICDQGELEIRQLGRALGLSKNSLSGCIEQLVTAGLLQPGAGANPGDADCLIRPTADGCSLARKILDNIY
jgi:DNA-binding MarR family transcriptional regulator